MFYTVKLTILAATNASFIKKKNKKKQKIFISSAKEV